MKPSKTIPHLVCGLLEHLPKQKLSADVRFPNLVTDGKMPEE